MSAEAVIAVKALQIALAAMPAIAYSINLATLPPLPEAAMTELKKAMDDAVAQCDASIEQKFGK